MVTIHPSAGNTLTLRVSLERVPGTLGKLTSALGRAGALVGSIDILEHQREVIVRQIQVETRGESHGLEVVAAARAVVRAPSSSEATSALTGAATSARVTSGS